MLKFLHLVYCVSSNLTTSNSVSVSPSFQFPQSLAILAVPLGLPESFGIS